MRTELDAVFTIWQRDMLHFTRERSRVFGALAQPLLFWLVLGTGIGSMFASRVDADINYLAFMFPGMIGLTLLFTSIFSTISVIADREHGFLKEILVSPISRSSIVIGKIAAGSTVALMQGILLLTFAPFVGLRVNPTGFLGLLLAMSVLAFALTGLGLMIAWQMRSTQGFHMIMNFFLVPMWLLSGAMFPVEGVPSIMKVLMRLNPLTYGIDAMRALFIATEPAPTTATLPYIVSLLAISGFALLMTLGAIRVCRQ